MSEEQNNENLNQSEAVLEDINNAEENPGIQPDAENTVVSLEEKTPAKKSKFKLYITILVVALSLLIVCCGGYYAGEYLNSNFKPKQEIADYNSYNYMTADEVFNAVDKSIVGIVVYNASGAKTFASGVVISSDGYIITNDHIYSGIQNAKFKIILNDFSSLDAKYVAGDSRSDIAVLKASASNLTAANFGDSSKITNGEEVVAIGRFGSVYDDSKITKGIISAKSVRVSATTAESLTTTSYAETFIQTDAAINPGSSGGALCNMYGQVIGVTSAKLKGDDYESVSYAIPSVKAIKIAESLIKNGYVNFRAKIGVTYQFVDEVTAEVNKSVRGMKIINIDETSDAYGKLKADDIITTVNGREIYDSNVMLDVIENSVPGNSISITAVTADGATINTSIKLMPDRGNSSYNANESSNKNESNYNSSEFSFPDID